MRIVDGMKLGTSAMSPRSWQTTLSSKYMGVWYSRVHSQGPFSIAGHPEKSTAAKPTCRWHTSTKYAMSARASRCLVVPERYIVLSTAAGAAMVHRVCLYSSTSRCAVCSTTTPLGTCENEGKVKVRYVRMCVYCIYTPRPAVYF